jgi:N-acetylglucosaminyldiphosphoundecaprenol N-acetyl-beta-D-mannosaminyltransferase
MGVGGSIDIVAGVTRRAPRWMQAAGLEWLFRLAQEPRRLGRRYLVTNAQFLGLLGRELLRRRTA